MFAFGLEALDHDVLSAEQGEEMRDAPAVGVEKRNGVQFDGPIFDVESQTDVLRMQINVSVRQHYTLGIGARAAGVEKLGQ